jgi:hypothetical protein
MSAVPGFNPVSNPHHQDLSDAFAFMMECLMGKEELDYVIWMIISGQGLPLFEEESDTHITVKRTF